MGTVELGIWESEPLCCLCKRAFYRKELVARTLRGGTIVNEVITLGSVVRSSILSECEGCHNALVALIDNADNFLRCQLCKTPAETPTLTYAALTTLFVDHGMPAALGRVHVAMIRPDIHFERYDEAHIFGNYWCSWCRLPPNSETNKQSS